jgi:hypothetical protein
MVGSMDNEDKGGTGVVIFLRWTLLLLFLFTTVMSKKALGVIPGKVSLLFSSGFT